jgi:hypothetical protein
LNFLANFKEKNKMGELVIYQSGENKIEVSVEFENETVWATQRQMAEIFDTTPQNITLHLKRIYKDGEIEELSTCKESLQVQIEGKRKVKRKQLFYNLDAILSVGYKINSKQGTLFRKWASARLKDYLVTGYAPLYIANSRSEESEVVKKLIISVLNRNL